MSAQELEVQFMKAFTSPIRQGSTTPVALSIFSDTTNGGEMRTYRLTAADARQLARELVKAVKQSATGDDDDDTDTEAAGTGTNSPATDTMAAIGKTK